MTDDSGYFDADGLFKSVEDAATHAVVVQGGWTTARIEAERMARSSHPRVKAMGEAWLVGHPQTKAARVHDPDGRHER